MSLLLNMLSRLVITFLPRSKRLLISSERVKQGSSLYTVFHLAQKNTHKYTGRDAYVLLYLLHTKDAWLNRLRKSKLFQLRNCAINPLVPPYSFDKLYSKRFPSYSHSPFLMVSISFYKTHTYTKHQKKKKKNNPHICTHTKTKTFLLTYSLMFYLLTVAIHPILYFSVYIPWKKYMVLVHKETQEWGL